MKVFKVITFSGEDAYCVASSGFLRAVQMADKIEQDKADQGDRGWTLKSVEEVGEIVKPVRKQGTK